MSLEKQKGTINCQLTIEKLTLALKQGNKVHHDYEE